MFDYVEIDRAAQAGFDAYESGVRMPSWVLKDQMLADAWSVGRRQAADKARTR
jgi:hypothetical protein